VCEIYKENLRLYTGVAILHPNDRVDRVVGKKIALGRALQQMWPSTLDGDIIIVDDIDEPAFEIMKIEAERKLKRKVIWSAFWMWVAQWPNQGFNPYRTMKRLCDQDKIVFLGMDGIHEIGGMHPDATTK
jgi:hypothetical protein